MGESLRLLTIDDQEIPLASLQRAVPFCAVWPMKAQGSSENRLAIGPDPNSPERVWAVVQRDEVGPGTAGAHQIVQYLKEIYQGGPTSAAHWLRQYLERVRAIYAFQLYPDAILQHPDAIRAIGSLREAIRGIIGGIVEYDDFGFTNESDRLIWLIPSIIPKGKLDVAILDESGETWIPYTLDLGNSEKLSSFLQGNPPL